MRLSHLMLALAPLVGAAPSMAMAQVQQAAAVPALSIADDNLDFMGTKYLRDLPTIIVPTAFLYVPAEGKLSAVSQGGMFSRNKGTARSTFKFVVSGLNRSGLQAVAKQLQDDLVKQLRAQGLTVQTYDDVKENGDVLKMDRYEIDKDWGAPTRSLPSLDGKYVVITPSDAQAIKPAFQGPVWGWRGVAKGTSSIVIIPEYVFNSPQLWGEKGSGYASTLTAKVNASPGVTLVGATTYFINNRAAAGLIKLKESLSVADSVGTLSEVRDDTPRAANAISAGLSMLGGGGSIQRKVGMWEMAIDPPKLAAALLAGGQAYNSAFAAAMAKERK